MISAHTFLAEHIPLLNFIAFALLAKKYVRNYPKIRIGTALSKPNHVETRRIHSVAIIRALTYLITVFAIWLLTSNAFQDTWRRQSDLATVLWTLVLGYLF